MKKEKCLDYYIYISSIITCVILILLVILYKYFFYTVPISSCLFYENFGLYCPGCGCTRAFEALFNFNIIDSIYYNPTVLYSVLGFSIYILTQTIDRIRKSKKFIMPYSNIYMYIGISILIINCIIRNIMLIKFKIYL